jgi:hypothetical protein
MGLHSNARVQEHARRCQARHPHIHDHEVGNVTADVRDRLLTRARLADPAKARDHLDDAPRDLPERRLVVHQHVARGLAIGLTFDGHR